MAPHPITAARSTADLTVLWRQFCHVTATPYLDAEEVLHTPELDPYVRQWVTAFVQQWSVVQRREDAEPYVDRSAVDPTPLAPQMAAWLPQALLGLAKYAGFDTVAEARAAPWWARAYADALALLDQLEGRAG